MERKTVVIAQSDLERQKAVCEQIREYWLAQGRTPLAFVDTYGCQQNEADSERIRGMLQSCGYQLSDTEEGADCIVINTCAIREHAETRVYGNVGALVHTKARHPGQKIFLCGCMMGQPAVADRIKKSYRHVDGVFNPHQLWRFPELLQFVLAHNKRIFATDDSAGNIAEGLPVRAHIRPQGVGVDHVRLQQFLLLLHRALRAGPRASRAGRMKFWKRCAHWSPRATRTSRCWART